MLKTFFALQLFELVVEGIEHVLLFKFLVQTFFTHLGIRISAQQTRKTPWLTFSVQVPMLLELQSSSLLLFSIT